MIGLPEDEKKEFQKLIDTLERASTKMTEGDRKYLLGYAEAIAEHSRGQEKTKEDPTKVTV